MVWKQHLAALADANKQVVIVVVITDTTAVYNLGISAQA